MQIVFRIWATRVPITSEVLCIAVLWWSSAYTSQPTPQTHPEGGGSYLSARLRGGGVVCDAHLIRMSSCYQPTTSIWEALMIIAHDGVEVTDPCKTACILNTYLKTSTWNDFLLIVLWIIWNRGNNMIFHSDNASVNTALGAIYLSSAT
jgi:hypothetical protein